MFKSVNELKFSYYVEKSGVKIMYLEWFIASIIFIDAWGVAHHLVEVLRPSTMAKLSPIYFGATSNLRTLACVHPG